LFPEDTNLRSETLDGPLLVLVDPAGQGGEQSDESLDGTGSGTAIASIQTGGVPFDEK
jgi:hypothetical protein